MSGNYKSNTKNNNNKKPNTVAGKKRKKSTYPLLSVRVSATHLFSIEMKGNMKQAGML